MSNQALNDCPFCGAGQTRSEGKYTSPTMNGKQSLISWEIFHWCERPLGVVARSCTVRGREKEDAVAAWNARAK